MGNNDIVFRPSLLRWVKVNSCLTTIFVAGIFSMFIALLAGGLSTTTVMTRMDDGMSRMVKFMVDGNDAAINAGNYIKNKFPSDQPEITAGQVIGIIENVHKISTKAEVLVESIKQETVTTIAAQLEAIMGTITPLEIEQAKSHVLSIIAHADAVISAIPPEKIANLVNVVGALDSAKINQLIETFSKLHEIKINI